jgi:hypothetical protein
VAVGVERRRELRLQRRRERLRNLWRIVVLAGAATGLGWLLLRHGWALRTPAQIEVLGSRQVSRDQVIREGELKLPLQLLPWRKRFMGFHNSRVLRGFRVVSNQEFLVKLLARSQPHDLDLYVTMWCSVVSDRQTR